MNGETEEIKVACVGAGYFSTFHYDAWRRIENALLVASVDLNLQAAKATGLTAFDDVEKMLIAVKPDLLDIITPPPMHFDTIKKAINLGVKTIVCQKPFCTTIDVAKEAAELGEKNNVTIIVHENFRFQPWYRTIKEKLENGLIGDVHQLTFRLRTGDGQGAEAYLERQPYFQEMERFLIHETGVHWIDTFRYLMGDPRSVYADLRQINPHIAGEDAGYFIMEFEAGRRAIFDANRHLDHAAENCRTTLGECLVEGTHGTLSLLGNGALKLRKFGSQFEETILEPKQWPGFAGDCVHALQSHIIKGLLQDGTLENTASEYIRILELEAAIYQSAKTGCKLSV